MSSYAQYLRIEEKAGGARCGRRAFIRASRRLLTKAGRSRAHRGTRHEWLQAHLAHHAVALAIFKACSQR